MKLFTLCYKTKKPIIYNEGTRWEKQHSTFLFCYLNNYTQYNSVNEICARLNQEKPATWYNGLKIDWNIIDYFYVNIQEEMCD